jgi:hypothetical protein
LLCCHCLAFVWSTYWPNDIKSLWGLLICIWGAHSLSVLFLEDHTFLVDGKGVFEQQTWAWRFWATWNNPRLLFTSRSDRCHTTSKREEDPQSRVMFAAGRLAKLAAYWTASNHIKPLILPGAFIPLYAADFDATRQTFFRRLVFFDEQYPITMRETSLRAIIACFWAMAPYVRLDAAHCVLSLVFVVVLRADPPEKWPPLYGDLRKAYSLRRFWGHFWHRLVVVPYGNVGKLLAMWCLGFPPGSQPYKLVVACTIFVLSGGVHAVVACRLGGHYWYLDIWWFFLNFLVVTAEGLVYFKVFKKADKSDGHYAIMRSAFLNHGTTRKFLGFAWVYLFFFWSVPKWQYPKVYSLIMELTAPGGNET